MHIYETDGDGVPDFIDVTYPHLVDSDVLDEVTVFQAFKRDGDVEYISIREDGTYAKEDNEDLSICSLVDRARSQSNDNSSQHIVPKTGSTPISYPIR